ncbi:MAG: hypothetical protein ACYDDF_14345 [Thermoplasmatota archaeon]
MERLLEMRGVARLYVAGALALVTLGSVGTVAYLESRPLAPTAARAYEVTIVARNETIWNGTLRLSNATALSGLLAACGRARCNVTTVEYPGLGTYVSAIGPYRASGPSGWLYEVLVAGRWSLGDRSAARFPLGNAMALRWRWTDTGE